ncbi:programmed cell death protein [Coelomomyces lativittatus]|nr:programmed cell death protein [Coelomomyces lativittatus]KAJ1514945.1 programmed cell death protein [Coelomomyces lativittatus]KAJ1515390.1 programmed cell death protein [Coelomomyces lativittatus]
MIGSESSSQKSSRPSPTYIAFSNGKINLPKLCSEKNRCRVGGPPTPISSTYPPFPLYTCSHCHSPLYLLSQLNFRQSNKDSLYYVLGCNRNTCMKKKGSFKAIRSTTVLKKKAPVLTNNKNTSSHASKNLETFSFKPFLMELEDTSSSSSERDTASSSSLSLEKTQTLINLETNISTPTSTKPTHLELEPYPCSFPSHTVYFEVEVLETKLKSAHHYATYAMDMDTLNTHDSSLTLDGEYEKPKRRIPKRLHQFLKRCESHPGQLIRYSETPLYYSDISLVHGPSQCMCGGQWKFMYQLMPTLLTLLPIEEEALLHRDPTQSPLWHEGMEFGTVLVFTCENQCESFNEHPYFEEQCSVQFEHF